MKDFFTNKFKEMDDESRESFLKTVFMNDDSEYAMNARREYYKSKLKAINICCKNNRFSFIYSYSLPSIFA